MVEPIQGEAGVYVPSEGYLAKAKALCEKHNVLFIADEVQTGFGRTGKWFACEDENIEPDIVTTAKGIAAGLPLSGVTGREEIMDSIHLSGLGGTYGGNPIACAAALAAIEIIETEKLVERARHLEAILKSSLEAIAAKHPEIGEIRGRGAMIAIELVKPGSKDPNTELMAKVIKYCQSKGVLILTAGTYGNVIRFLPPLVITDELLKDALGVLAEGFASL